MTQRFQILSTSAYLVATVLLVALCIRASDGHLIYTLDDPYIHLAVAENILHGGYGVNLSEFSSPSSSIIWPYIIAGALWVGAGDWAPLLVNVTASAASVWIFSGFLWKHAITDVQLPGKRWWLLLVVPLLLLSINAIALPMTGMEHSLHVLGCLLVVSGLADLARKKKIPPLLPFGIILCPLVRFEGMALSLAALVVMVCVRKYWSALFTAIVLAVFLGMWAALMTEHSLPILPSSVLVKSGISAAAVDGNLLPALKSAASHLYSSLTGGKGFKLALSIALLLILSGMLTEEVRKRKSVLIVVAPAIFSLAAHLLFGQYGWFGRYEVYVVAIALASLAWTYALAAPTGYGYAFRFSVICIALAIAGAPYFAVTVKTPSASRNIYEQQFQMHRFVTEFFPQKVAVNDLGYVAYRNDNYVLDLWGLGSEQVRRLRTSGRLTSEAVVSMTEDRGVVFAMVYDRWFTGVIPPQWCRIAVLQTSRVTAADDQVAFYLVNRDQREAMTAALAAFSSTIPRGASLQILGCDAL